MSTEHLPVWTVVQKRDDTGTWPEGVIMEVHNAADPDERTWYSVAVLARGRILGRCWYADEVAAVEPSGRARLPVLTVSEGDANGPIVLTGDRANQGRAADLLHQDVRLVPVGGA